MASHHLSRREVIRLGLGLSLSPFLSAARLKNNPLIMTASTTTDVPRRAIPVTGEMIPVVGLGTWRTFDAGNSKEKRAPLVDVLKALRSRGASVIDSSPMYGSSETVVGDLSQELKIRPALFLATKVWTSGKEEGIQQMNQSFQKMRADKMDLMQVHNLVDVHTHLKTLKDWKEQGKIRYTGITHYTPGAYPEMMRLIKSGKPDFIQCCYNIHTRDAEKQLLPLAKENGVAVLINRPFEEGQLFNRVRNHSLPPWARDHAINSWAQFFLKFVLSHPAVTCAIPGTSNAAHMEENIASAENLPDEKLRNKMANHFASI